MAGKRGMEVDPDDLDAAAQAMRRMAVRDFHTSQDLEAAETARAGDQYIFGRSAEAQELAAKWDGIVHRRVNQVEDLGTATQELAEDLERTADDYRRGDQGSAETLTELHRGLGA